MRNLTAQPLETLTAVGAGTLHTAGNVLSKANAASSGIDFTVSPTGCSITDCVIEIQRVSGGSWFPLMGGTDYDPANNHPLLKWSFNSTALKLPNSLTTTQVGSACVSLLLFYAYRFAITVSGAGTVAVNVNEGEL